MGVVLTVDDGIAEIVLDRPEKLNTMTPDMYRELGEAFIRVREDPDISVALLHGAGSRAFCAGGDLSESLPKLADGQHDISEWDAAHLKNIDLFKPVVAAVDGWCLGAGLEILLGTDIRIAARTAVFGLPEAGKGLVPAGGTLARLTRQIPYTRAMDLLLSSRRIDAAEAYSMGLVSSVVEPEVLLKVAWEKAVALSRQSQQSLRVIKESVIRLGDMPLSVALHAEAVYGQKGFRSPDAHEGLAAFREGRSPNFCPPAQQSYQRQ
ncbi:enoyl-CoA hydratase/isomerase family protein [Streptomyces nigra]|uniref:enoyl-CoA hydratase/isomerase family protein n=1 Tax=Streptomyces nigra TaxID=1827580 RepID=UPI0037CF2F5A